MIDHKKPIFHRCFSIGGAVVTSSHSAIELSRIYNANQIDQERITDDELEQLEWLTQMVFDRQSKTWGIPTPDQLPIGGFEASPGASVQMDGCVIFRGIE